MFLPFEGLPPLQNGVKRVETRPVENGNKVEDGDDKVEQTAADVHIFKQVQRMICNHKNMFRLMLSVSLLASVFVI